jgi:hypothetical protein
LHVLGTPPAFVLSQDQTLHISMKKLISSSLLRLKIRTHRFPINGVTSTLRHDVVPLIEDHKRGYYLRYRLLCSVFKVLLFLHDWHVPKHEISLCHSVLLIAHRRQKLSYHIFYSKSNNYFLVFNMVEPSGIEPLTSCVQGRRSPS